MRIWIVCTHGIDTLAATRDFKNTTLCQAAHHFIERCESFALLYFTKWYVTVESLNNENSEASVSVHNNTIHLETHTFVRKYSTPKFWFVICNQRSCCYWMFLSKSWLNVCTVSHSHTSISTQSKHSLLSDITTLNACHRVLIVVCPGCWLFPCHQ